MSGGQLGFARPKVSILMTAFNRKGYIRAAIESVIAQTFVDWELIIVDDCSTDGTPDVARRYAERDCRIRVVLNERNLGDYPNRSHAATFARGKYLKYHDSDDLLYPHCLATMVGMLDAEPRAAFALSSGSYWRGGPCPMLSSPADSYRREFLGSGMFSLGPACGLFRTEWFRSVGGFENTGASSDTVFWLRACATAHVLLVPGDLFWYRVHAGQELQSARAQRDYALLPRRVWAALNGPECPLAGEELEHAKRNLVGRLFRQSLEDARSGQFRIGAMRMSSIPVRDWIRYLRRPRRSASAGSVLDRDGEFLLPSLWGEDASPVKACQDRQGVQDA